MTEEEEKDGSAAPHGMGGDLELLSSTHHGQGTVKNTLSIHSTNPQNLGEKIIHTCIYQPQYWREGFDLTAELAGAGPWR